MCRKSTVKTEDMLIPEKELVKELKCFQVW